ncbi:class I SAM-dependent methyltransferase [Mesorhizobium soli]|uniref:class I SAM-dependent methyltransferase n=1 Tax=Pseudaminobacter soli (ex Li et al. 2025) TaxID=1295366 RepID=UPI00247400C2|nr:50S ribosomal protein L11 methyltransferase [Mesorhizobium soli]
MNSVDIQKFIRANLPVVPVPAVPEIRLHRAGPSSGLWRLAEADEQGFGSPYWAYCWAGGLALARHILVRPQVVAGRRVLDLGSGSGIVGITAAKAGASAVIAAEVDRYAIEALKLNAAANDVALEAIHSDLTAGPPPAVDVVAVGDLFYDQSLAARVTAFLDRCLDAGIEVLIGDPWRAWLPRDRLRVVAEYSVSDMGVAKPGDIRPSAVFAFERG